MRLADGLGGCLASRTGPNHQYKEQSTSPAPISTLQEESQRAVEWTAMDSVGAQTIPLVHLAFCRSLLDLGDACQAI